MLNHLACMYYRPQTKSAKVTFLHLSVSHSVHRGDMGGKGGMHGSGACMVWGMCGRGHAWRGGMHDWGCMAGGMCGRGHAWQGGMHGRGHVWQGACMAGHTCPPADTTRYSQWAGGTHSTGMHSCLDLILSSVLVKRLIPAWGLHPKRLY